MDIAHRGFIEYENRISGILAAFRVVDMVEVDVRFHSETQEVILAHDRDSSPWNDRFQDLCVVMHNYPNKKLMVDIKAEGIDEARRLARSVYDIVRVYPMAEYLLGSFNEYCVEELLSIRISKGGWCKVGVISAGVSIGLWAHLPGIDFVSVEHSHVNQEITSSLHKRGILVFAWVVNDVYAKWRLYQNNVDGVIVDLYNNPEFHFKKKIF